MIELNGGDPPKYTDGPPSEWPLTQISPEARDPSDASNKVEKIIWVISGLLASAGTLVLLNKMNTDKETVKLIGVGVGITAGGLVYAVGTSDQFTSGQQR